MASTKDIAPGLEMVRIQAKDAVAQDQTWLMIVAHNDKGEQFYVKAMEWAPYRGLDILDTSEMCLPGRVEVRVTGNGNPR